MAFFGCGTLSPTTEARQPNWRPIEMLPSASTVVTEMLDGAAEQRRLLSGARAHSLDL